MADAPSNLRESTTDPDLSGRQLDDFHLLRRLAHGAMAEVYLAEQGSLRRQVALKVLKSELAKDESYVKRFHNEAHAAASLVHANIVQIHSVGCADGVHYIAQEYVQGQNLAEWMARRGPPDLTLAVKIMRQVAAALSKAAERGIIHRDIKPENIMLARTGEVKVADFGLARQSGDGAAPNLTQVGVTMGTPLYMSPEQVEGRAIDPRSDLYSFGVTCYQMLAGRPPFRGETALAIAVQHLNSQPERLELSRPDLPPAMCRIVHKLLAKDPQGRYESARELLRDLRGLQVPGETEPEAEDVEGAALAADTAEVGAGLATSRLAVVMKSQAQPVIRRRQYVLWAAGLLSAFAAGGLAAWATREPFLLAESEEVRIPKEKTAGEQFMFAQIASTHREAWLKSVGQYFPEADHYVARSKEELARYYMRLPRDDEALELFHELANMTEPEFKAYGLAGESIVLTRQKKWDEALQSLAKLAPLRSDLNDARMASLALWAFRENRNRMGEQEKREWDEWQRTLPSEEADSQDGG
ncbi:MAG: serine/threonine protein kinase [Planctomycetia bacterium]|nr:serine/threonine protein kinase [Planctomycetia bacterium]